MSKWNIDRSKIDARRKYSKQEIVDMLKESVGEVDDWWDNWHSTPREDPYMNNSIATGSGLPRYSTGQHILTFLRKYDP